MKMLKFISFFSRFALSLNKTGGTSEEEMNGFISFFSRFALSLQKISLLEKNDEKTFNYDTTDIIHLHYGYGADFSYRQL